MKFHRIPVGLLLVFATVAASGWQSGNLLEFATATCQDWDGTAGPAPGFANGAVVESEIRFRETTVGTRYRFEVDDNARVELDVIVRAGQQRFVSSLFGEFGDPLVLLSLDADCDLQVARRINYNEHGQAINIDTLDVALEPRGEPDWLNPPLQLLERKPGKPLKHPGNATPVRVGMVDSGVNYRLPEINQRLARDADGQLVGYDFWDMDDLPYDAHPVNSGFFLQRHGTRTASLLLREAPAVELVPYRYPRPDMSRMQALVEHAVENQVFVLGMPLGSNRLADWGSFERAARDHPEMLFIVSAGNDGRDIDERPVYPAALDLDNLVVVTSADDFVQPAERTNWGRISVDYLVPAERLAALDYSGSETRVSGSSYAVARVTALAARLKATHPQWNATDIKRELRNRYGNSSPGARDWVSTGYIADPLAGAAVLKQPLPDLNLPRAETGFGLALDVVVLDSRWVQQRVGQAVRQAYEILAQCAIVAGEVSIYAVEAEDYLRDLSTGSARTLLEAVDGE
ncbi:MAG: S8/S53 family peptidase, partial [Gammaproteobacteria bacterium]|nr:S8/S53 family peptidase [Gammaproteobacteria bacterium]